MILVAFRGEGRVWQRYGNSIYRKHYVPHHRLAPSLGLYASRQIDLASYQITCLIEGRWDLKLENIVIYDMRDRRRRPYDGIHEFSLITA